MSVFSDIQTRSFAEHAADWLTAYLGGWLIGAGFLWFGIGWMVVGVVISVALYHHRMSEA